MGLAIGAPLAAAVVGVFVAPEATLTIPDRGRIVLQLLVFGAASLTLFALGRRGRAAGLAVVVLHGIVMAVGRVSSSRRLGNGHG